MKKLSKLTINPSKVMKNEELVNLKGGQYTYNASYSNGTLIGFNCYCTDGSGFYTFGPDDNPISCNANCGSGYHNCYPVYN
jgi:hypothetical protein